MITSTSSHGALRSLILPTVIALLAGCSGAGSSSPQPSVIAASAQRVSGTLQIGVPATSATTMTSRFADGTRSPEYVSGGTKHAALFIDGATAAAGSTTSCTSSSCSISWSATLNVPATHTFAVEVDDGGHHPTSGSTPYVLAEGSGAYSVVAGSGNALSTLSLNGVASEVTLAGAPTCSSNSCTDSVQIDDSDFYGISYTGASYTTPGNGQTPTTGQVYDNDGGGSDPVIVKADSSTGKLTGTTQSPFSSFNADQSTLTINGVSTNGSYTITATCASGKSGNFGITITGAATPSNDVTSAELSGLSPAVSYSLYGSPDADYQNLFTCTSGQISAPGAAAGTLPVG